MTNPPPPVVVKEKKRGMGCCGCGCLILFLLALLFGAVIGGVSYVAYKKVNELTSSTPTVVQSFDGGDDVYHTATQKLTDFDQALQHHQAATLHLSADELNTLIARSPNFKANNIQAFVTISDDVMEVKTSIPLNIFQLSLFKDRYFNGIIASGLDFDSENKEIHLLLKRLRIGTQAVPENYLPTAQAEITPVLNQELRQNPEAKSILDQAKSIEIKNGELVIELQ